MKFHYWAYYESGFIESIMEALLKTCEVSTEERSKARDRAKILIATMEDKDSAIRTALLMAYQCVVAVRMLLERRFPDEAVGR